MIKDKKIKKQSSHTFKCKMCNKNLKTWNSLQKGFGPVCECKFLKDVYENQQMKIEDIAKILIP